MCCRVGVLLLPNPHDINSGRSGPSVAFPPWLVVASRVLIVPLSCLPAPFEPSMPLWHRCRLCVANSISEIVAPKVCRHFYGFKRCCI